jgi:hypothetical protein
MITYRQARHRASPKRVNLGPKLFSKSDAIYSYTKRTVEHAPEDAELLLTRRPSLDDSDLADALVEAGRIVALTIGEPQTITIACDRKPFRSEDINFDSGWRATVKVPFGGTAALWYSELGNAFNAELQGEPGRENMRIKDVLDTFEVEPLRDFVIERLDAVRARLYVQDGPISAYNEVLERDLRAWVAANGSAIEQMREGRKGRRSTESA